MDEAFYERARRIEARKGAAVGSVRPGPPRKGIRWGWSVLGFVWGFSALTAVAFANVNYDRAMAERAEAPEGALLVGWTALFGLGSMALLVLLVLIGVIFLRRKRGFWHMVVAFLFGMATSGLALSSM